MKTDRKSLEGFKATSQTLLRFSEWIFNEDKPPSESVEWEWLSCLQLRETSLNHYKEKLYKNRDIKHRDSIYQSLIHMHCNRLMGVNLELEKKALVFAESTLLKLRYVLNKERSTK